MTARKPGKKWTAKDNDTLSQLWRRGVSPNDIANILQRSANATKMQANRLDLGIHPNYASGKSTKENPTKQHTTAEQPFTGPLKKEQLAEHLAWMAMVKAPNHLKKQAEYNLALAQQAEKRKIDILWPKMKNRE